jgi:hypothetical protein
VSGADTLTDPYYFYSPPLSASTLTASICLGKNDTQAGLISATSRLKAHMHLFHRHFFEHLSVFAFLFLIFLHEIEDIDGIHV